MLFINNSKFNINTIRYGTIFACHACPVGTSFANKILTVFNKLCAERNNRNYVLVSYIDILN